MDAASRPVRVLVVEDDEEIAQVLQRSLRLEGYEVKLAADGVRGLDEAHAFLPDIIVLDLGLPRLDGLDVARRLRDDGDDTPILMLTHATLWSRAWRAWMSAPTTSSASRSKARSCSPACAHCSGAVRRAAWPRCASAISRSTPTRTRSRARTGRSTSLSVSSSCSST